MSPGKEGTGEEFSAKRLALLQFYVTQIEGLTLMIYRSDPEKYSELTGRLQTIVVDLRRLAKQEQGEFRSDCDSDEERCGDGLCHPKGDPTCCSIIPIGSTEE